MEYRIDAIHLPCSTKAIVLMKGGSWYGEGYSEHTEWYANMYYDKVTVIAISVGSEEVLACNVYCERLKALHVSVDACTAELSSDEQALKWFKNTIMDKEKVEEYHLV